MAGTTETGADTSDGRADAGRGGSMFAQPGVQLALARLPNRQRRLLLLVYDGGLSPKEAGARLGLAENEVDAALARALARLARHLPR